MAGLLWYRSYMDSLANTSGYYPDIHAGSADFAIEITREAPYLIRETPAGYNQLELSSIIGGSVAWNQLCNSASVTGTSGHKFYLMQNGAESITSTNTFTGLTDGTDMVIDLTQMLGTAIADFVYALEQATAGEGVAWLKRYDLIDDQYHAYNAGSLESVEATSHIAKDGNGNVISTTTFGSVTLRGITKTDADGNLYYYGDTYSWDGTVNRRFAEVDLGSLNWQYSGSRQWFNVEAGQLSIKYESTSAFNNAIANAICSKYITVPYTYMRDTDPTVIACSVNNAGFFVIRDTAYTDPATFKTAMSGVKLVYELATQTTESADPYTKVQTVEEGGTEEFVTSNNVPVGNVSIYRRV